MVGREERVVVGFEEGKLMVEHFIIISLHLASFISNYIIFFILLEVFNHQPYLLPNIP